MNFLTKWTKKGQNPLLPETPTQNTEEIDNLGAQFNWFHIPEEESVYKNEEGMLIDKHVTLQLQMLDPPESVMGFVHPRTKLNLFVTKMEKIKGLEHLAGADHPDHPDVISGGARYFGTQEIRKPVRCWPKAHDYEIHQCYSMIDRFSIRGAKIGYIYLVEGRLLVEGCDHEFKLPSFFISYDSRKDFPKPHVHKCEKPFCGKGNILGYYQP
ncbi:hypothetical protein VTN31DRAFT_7492 [Thermomyces dupontii]|uniref:uncharacterized protein n=1 Tax=Talaromyces thermophilus TaxID=28565 RepID=UPI003743CDE3